MKFSFVLIFLMSLFMLGCGSSSSQETKSVSTTSKFLSIRSTPFLGVPISINQRFCILFSSDIDPTTVNKKSVYIEKLQENDNHPVVTGGFSRSLNGSSLDVASNKITITPYTYFNPNDKYKLVVTTGVKDVNGKSLAQNYVYAFTTASKSDDNGRSFNLESRKPSANSTTSLVSTDIVLDFSKNISSEAEYSSTPYISVNANGSAITGKIEVFNRLLKFIPDKPLPYNARINVTLNNAVFDIYGSESLSLDAWHFQTADAKSSPKSSLGFKSLSSVSLGKTAYLIRTIKNSTTESIIAVARDGGIDIYKVKYPTPQSKPTFEYVSSYAFNSQVNAMVGFSEKYLLVGTISHGVKVLDTSTNPISDVGDYNTTATIYSVKVDVNSDGFADKAYVVGPTFGLQVYDVNNTTGALTPTHSQSPSVLGEALDVATANIYETQLGKNIQKIYVADYKGRLVILDENATSPLFVDINFSPKKIVVQKDVNGMDSYLSLLSSSGMNKQMNFDGTAQGGLVDLTKSANDMLGYFALHLKEGDEGVTISNDIYYAVGSDGIAISISDANQIQQLISTSGDAVSFDFINDYKNGYKSGTSFLVTLNSDGLLQVFNANYDDTDPFLYNSPKNGDINVPINTTVSFYFIDEYLDASTITKSSFSIKDRNRGSEVSFSMSRNGEGIVVTPTKDLMPDHNYSVTITPTISDMIGNKLNNGVEKIINFKTVAQ